MRGVGEFCHRHNIFRFRCLGDTVGKRFLELPKTSAALFDVVTRSHWLRIRYPGGSEVRGITTNPSILTVAPDGLLVIDRDVFASACNEQG